MQPGAELLDDTRRNAVDEDAGRRFVGIDPVVAGRDEVEVGSLARVLEREPAAGREEAVVEPLIVALKEFAVEAVEPPEPGDTEPDEEPKKTAKKSAKNIQ